MKKTILQTLATALLVGLVMTSCLGDNNAEIKQNNVISYVKRGESGLNNTAMGGGWIFTNNFVDTRLLPSKFYYLDYVINTKDGVNKEGAYQASHVNYGGGGERDDALEEEYCSHNIKQETPTIYMSNLGVAIASPLRKYYDDKWVFRYEATVAEIDAKNDNIRLLVTVLDEDRVNSSGEPLEDNKIVVRLGIERENPSLPINNKETKKYYGEVAVDLSVVRNRLNMSEEIDFGGQKMKAGLIQFVYTKEIKENTHQDESIGSFTDISNRYYMVPESQN